MDLQKNNKQDKFGENAMRKPVWAGFYALQVRLSNKKGIGIIKIECRESQKASRGELGRVARYFNAILNELFCRTLYLN